MHRRRPATPTLLDDDARQPGGECADQAAGRPSCRGDLDPAGVRAERAAARAAPGAADGRADAAGEGSLSVTCATSPPAAPARRAGRAVRAGLQERPRPRAAVRRRGRPADGRARPDRQRRRHPRLRRPARARAAGRGRLHAGRGDQDRARSTARPISALPTASARSRRARTPTCSSSRATRPRTSTTSRMSIVVFKDGVGYDSAKLLAVGEGAATASTSAARACRASPPRRPAARRCDGRCRPSEWPRTAS